MTQSERNSMAFDTAVDNLLRERRKIADETRYLYSCVDNMIDDGYSGKYLDVYLAVSGMSDVESELESLECIQSGREGRHA